VAMAKEMYGNSMEQNFMELNASDERGIDVVRNNIKNFAKTLSFNAPFKVIFLDESDALTADAQQALRRTMEKYTQTTRFILSCNYSSRIIEPIQSRCVVYRFKSLAAADITNKLTEISKLENISLDEEGLKAIIYISEGDLRKAINVLEASASIDNKVNEKSVYSVASMAKPEEIKELINLSFKQKFLEARDKLDKVLYEHGMGGEEVILQMYREIVNMPESELDSKAKIELIDKIGEFNFRLVEGANERLQLEALIAQLMKYRKK